MPVLCVWNKIMECIRTVCCKEPGDAAKFCFDPEPRCVIAFAYALKGVGSQNRLVSCTGMLDETVAA